MQMLSDCENYKVRSTDLDLLRSDREERPGLVGSNGDRHGVHEVEQDTPLGDEQRLRELTVDELLDLVLEPPARRAAKGRQDVGVAFSCGATNRELSDDRPTVRVQGGPAETAGGRARGASPGSASAPRLAR